MDSLPGKAEKVVRRCSRLPERISISPRPAPGPRCFLTRRPRVLCDSRGQGGPTAGGWRGGAVPRVGGPPARDGELTTSQGVSENADPL